jgi:hypothetical protein
LLEHDADGLRYAPGTRLDDAIEEYRKAQRQLGPRNRLDTLEVNLALDLLYREKYIELEKLAARAEKSPSWRGFLVAAVAARQGVSDADKRATEVAASADARREILQNAAEYLQQARLYAAAGSLYEAAAQGAEKPDEIRAKAKAIAQLRRFKVEGDATNGFHVHASGEKLNESQWQVVMENGQARIAPPAQPAAVASDMAWSAIVAGKVTQQSLDEALAAVKENKHPDATSLRTLAAIDAELGKTPDALDNLRRAVELRGEQIEDGDWYVLGRIAEQYGLDELAAGLYRKVPLTPPAGGEDAYAVAQRRLKKVEKR